jgi:hypothetical protein
MSEHAMPQAEPQQCIGTSRPGFVRIQVGNRDCAARMLPELASRYRQVILQSRVFHHSRLPGYGHADASLELPDNPGAIEEVAKAAGFTTSELAPGFLLIAPAGEPSGSDSLVLTADRVEGMGSDQPFAISQHELERLLLVQASPISTSHHSLYPDLWFAVYYWPSVEGAAKELYAVTQSSGDLHPQGPPSRGLAKYVIEHDNGRAKLRPLWHSGCEGPVAELELDFDGDQVIDVVCFSGSEGTQQRSEPLVVVSGKTGEAIGTLDGYQVVILETPGGAKTFATFKRDGYRTYVLGEDGRLTLQRFVEVDTFGDPPLFSPRRKAAQGEHVVAALRPGERIIHNFVVQPAPVTVDTEFEKVPVLGAVGERLTLPPGGAKALEAAHILLDYQPTKAHEHQERP